MKTVSSMSLFGLFLLMLGAQPAGADARMTFVGPKSTYADVGLRTGDIVLEVDDAVPASAGEVASLIFAALRKPGRHTIVITRGGEHLTLSFSGK